MSASSYSACEKLMRMMRKPSSVSFCVISGLSDTGPIVPTIYHKCCNL